MAASLYHKLKTALHFFIYSNLLIAFCALAMTTQTYLLLGIPIQWDTLMPMIFTGTLVGYLLPRFLVNRKMTTDTKQKLGVTNFQIIASKYLLIASIVSSIALFFVMKTSIQIGLLITGGITIFYTLPLFKWNQRLIKLREIGMSKIFLITLVWVGTCVFLPYINASELGIIDSFSYVNLSLLSIEKALFIFAITLPFDLRDMQYDQLKKLQTIPLLIGQKRSLQLAYFSLISASILAVINYGFLVNSPSFILVTTLCLSYLLTMYIVAQTHPKQPDKFYVGCLDATMLMQSGLVFLAI